VGDTHITGRHFGGDTHITVTGLLVLKEKFKPLIQEYSPITQIFMGDDPRLGRFLAHAPIFSLLDFDRSPPPTERLLRGLDDR